LVCCSVRFCRHLAFRHGRSSGEMGSSTSVLRRHETAFLVSGGGPSQFRFASFPMKRRTKTHKRHRQSLSRYASPTW
jgi:hypothetical protein